MIDSFRLMSSSAALPQELTEAARVVNERRRIVESAQKKHN